MLTVVEEKAADGDLDITCLQANLVELTADLVPDESVDYAMCMFSTLGMIRGHANRQRVLAQHVSHPASRAGKFVVHVHNFWFNLRDPGGPWWVLRNLVAGAVSTRAGGRRQVLPLPRRARHVPARVPSPRTASGCSPALGFASAGGFRWKSPAAIRSEVPMVPAQRLRANGWIVVGEKPLQ